LTSCFRNNTSLVHAVFLMSLIIALSYFFNTGLMDINVLSKNMLILLSLLSWHKIEF
jgi:hypothetical protein